MNKVCTVCVMLLKTIDALKNIFVKRWNAYKYRFVPWISLNLTERTLRSTIKENDKILTDSEVEHQLCSVLNVFNDIAEGTSLSELSQHNSERLYEVLGYRIDRRQSTVTDAGTGVVVTQGTVPKATVVALYPGLIYRPAEPVLFQSIRNPFIFRCIDGLLIDGNDKGLSRIMFRSCAQRDRVGPYMTADMSWLTQYPVNPLAVGQFVNNQSKENEANVAYQEFDVPHDFPFRQRKYIPNAFYSACSSEAESNRLTRTVALVSLREIHAGEELFSNYFTIVR